jgi:hypothetical protein
MPPTKERVEKICASCGRRITLRRRWKRQWSEVRYCSHACRKRGIRTIDQQLEDAMLGQLNCRRRGASICPSETARAVAGDTDWRQLMEPVRRAARRLANRDLVQILQGGRVVDPSDFRGPIRVRSRIRSATDGLGPIRPKMLTKLRTPKSRTENSQ